MDVYIIKNTKTGKSYVGSTSSFKMRMKSHFSALKTHKHSSKQMQKDFDLYGKDSFVCKVIGQYNDKLEALRMEKFYICMLRATNKRYGYNTAGSSVPEREKRKQATPLQVVRRKDYNVSEKITMACARVNAKMTQAQMAKELGISRTYYNRIENGIVDPPPAFLLAFTYITNFSEDELFIPSRTI